MSLLLICVPFAARMFRWIFCFSIFWCRVHIKWLFVAPQLCPLASKCDTRPAKMIKIPRENETKGPMQKLWQLQQLQQIMQIKVHLQALLSRFPANVALLANNNDNNLTSIKVGGTSHTENWMTCVCVCARMPREMKRTKLIIFRTSNLHFNFLIRIYYGELKTWRTIFHNFLSVVVCCSPPPLITICWLRTIVYLHLSIYPHAMIGMLPNRCSADR